MCPLCGVSIEEIDVEKHYEVELDKLINAGLLFILICFKYEINFRLSFIFKKMYYTNKILDS